jgi:endonuclease YncB( thermonuclease family)
MSELPEKTKALRGSKQKTQREIWQAALFAHGMSVSLNYPSLELAISEDEDYDCVVRWIDGDTEKYVPVQLKEVVPTDLNPATSIYKELSKLSKYVASPELVIALFLNRAGRIDLVSVKAPVLSVAELWFFGNKSRDQSKWMLYGNVLSNPLLYEFAFPANQAPEPTHRSVINDADPAGSPRHSRRASR